ncbi:MAG: hypothetical protein H3C26_14645 [Rhodocyclaceae bacterium]|nr:hypothetical protein [Rhodocyclaceae bacterium]
MLNPNQADAAAEALMLERRAAQATAAEKRQAATGQLAARHRRAGWILAGMGIGALIGHFAFGNWLPAAFVGFGLGALVGRLPASRRS